MSWTLSKDRICECLRELANYDFQERTWLTSSGPEVSSFPEMVSQLFDDTGLGDALEANSDGLNNQTKDVLLELNKAILKVNQRLPPQELLKSREMHVVRETATKALLYLEEE